MPIRPTSSLVKAFESYRLTADRQTDRETNIQTRPKLYTTPLCGWSKIRPPPIAANEENELLRHVVFVCIYMADIQVFYPTGRNTTQSLRVVLQRHKIITCKTQPRDTCILSHSLVVQIKHVNNASRRLYSKQAQCDIGLGPTDISQTRSML